MIRTLSQRVGRLVLTTSLGLIAVSYASTSAKKPTAELIVHNSLITTLDPRQPNAQAIAVSGGKVIAVGSDDEILALRTKDTKVLNALGKRMIPGLNDSHSHYLRGGTSFTGELRWDGIPSLKIGLERIRKQARVTPPGQWVRVVGGFTPWQFEENRLPTPAELTEAAPEIPVYVQYFYSVIVVNKKGLELLKITKSTPDPKGGIIERDQGGTPTGVFIADPSPDQFYSLLGALPKFDEATAQVSTEYMFHELARFGLTSVVDAGGGGFNFPNDYAAPLQTMRRGKLPLRVSFYLFTQHPGKELDDYQNWMKANQAGDNLDQQREHGFELEGGGEWVLWKAGDYENFRSPRPTQEADMEEKLEPIVRQFVKNRWPFRIHATYDESITRLLNVIEKVNKTTPLNGLRWAIDHAETIKEKNADRIKALGGGVAVQDRMYFLGDDFTQRYGKDSAQDSPPLRMLLAKGIPVGMGTDGTRSSFNPWLGLYFLTTGKAASGQKLLSNKNILTREEALRLYSQGSAWFSQEEKLKGQLSPLQLADFVLLSKDYFSVAAEEIKTIESDLTVVGGKIVYGANAFAAESPTLPVILPAWSPLKEFGSFYKAPDQPSYKP